MSDTVRIFFARLLCLREQITFGEAMDIMRELSIQLQSIKDGSGNYSTVNEAIEDYLDIGTTWSHLFSN